MEIKNSDDDQIIQSFESENKVVNVNEMEKASLYEEYEQYSLNRILITDKSDIKLDKNNKLSFNIKCNLDSQILNEKEYEIQLKDNNNKIIKANCKFPIIKNLDHQIIPCFSSFDKE